MKSTSKPILFSGEMVRAILAGRKTQTRRVVKPQPDSVMNGAPYWNVGGLRLSDGAANPLQCPYGQPGDTLYVKETFRVWSKDGSLYTGRLFNVSEYLKKAFKQEAQYRATSIPDVEKGNWRPSIFMPPWLSRLTLKVQAVRVERLQDISEEDARAEGVSEKWLETAAGREGLVPVFSTLWNSLNGPGAWDANPWVWVVQFQLWAPF